MSVEITFEPDGSHGLVAEGTDVWHAAKRLGASISAECNGRGECDSCAVAIASGTELLSSITEAERKMLGTERVSQGQRLACQARIERSGEVIVRVLPAGTTTNEAASRRFRDLPVKEQVSALIEIEAVALSEAITTIKGKTRGFVQKAVALANRDSEKKD